MEKKQIFYLDSMGGAGKEVLNNIFRYLQDEHNNKHKKPLENIDQWCLLSPGIDRIPHQRNLFDCGVFPSLL